jgi:hypothetical protein
MKSKLTALGLLCAGAFGAALRIWSLKTAYEAGTNLAIAGAPALIILIVYAVAIPLLALGAAFWLQKNSSGAPSLYSGVSAPMSLLGIVAAVAITAGCFLRLMSNVTLLAGGNRANLMVSLVDLLMFTGGVCMLWIAVSGMHEGTRFHNSILPLVPGFAACMALVMFYQNNSRDPGVTHYCWILLSIMACVLALYHQASYAFDNPHPVRTQWATMTAGAYALLALPDAGSPSEVLILVGIALWMVQRCAVISSPCHSEEQRDEES